MMPSPTYFEKEAQKLGINTSSLIVVYDNLGVYSSPRARWMLKAMGHQNVAVLDGGLPEWIKRYDAEEKQQHKHTTGDFVAQAKHGYFIDSREVHKAIDTSNISILDARSFGRFEGTEPEPRPGLRGGHIPSSQCLPFSEVIQNGKMKSKEQMKASLAERNVLDHHLVSRVDQG